MTTNSYNAHVIMNFLIHEVLIESTIALKHKIYDPEYGNDRKFYDIVIIVYKS